jgi:hypothetical protein
MQMRAQFWSFDVIFAVIIFSFAITILAFTWFNISNQLAPGFGNGSAIMQTQLQLLTQNLFSAGVPSNWQGSINTTNSMTWGGLSIGLGSGQTGSTISSSKVYTLLSMSNSNYQATKQALGVGFDYYITIKSVQFQGSGINITMGRNPFNGKALTVYVADRNAVMNGVPVTVRTILWTNTTLATS